ncbi:MAG: hypothetical protein GYB25_06600 [Rhodobacteraceae bacterium]|nr:hypothetical protein [Paracoccaceae bacterium]
MLADRDTSDKEASARPFDHFAPDLKSFAIRSDVSNGRGADVVQEMTVLREALTRLAPSQREIIEKAYIGELSHTETQAATGAPLSTIKSRTHLVLEKLCRELKGTALK